MTATTAQVRYAADLYRATSAPVAASLVISICDQLDEAKESINALTLALEVERDAANLYAKQVAHWIEKHDALLAQQLDTAPAITAQPSQARELSDTQLLDYLQSAQDGVVICTHKKCSLKTDGSNDYEIRLVFDGWTTHSRITDKEKPTVRDAIIAAINAKERT